MFEARLPSCTDDSDADRVADFVSSSSFCCASVVLVVAWRASECITVATARSCANPTSPTVSTSEATIASTSEKPASHRAVCGLAISVVLLRARCTEAIDRDLAGGGHGDASVGGHTV